MINQELMNAEEALDIAKKIPGYTLNGKNKDLTMNEYRIIHHYEKVSDSKEVRDKAFEIADVVTQIHLVENYLECIATYNKPESHVNALILLFHSKEWSRKTRLAQKRIRELVDSNDYLSRNYPREKVYTPINTLLKDFSYEDLDKNGIIRKTINVEKYNRHVLGTKEYEAYVQRGTKAGGKPSYLTISADKAQKYVDSLLTNEALKQQRKTADFPTIIGYYVDQKTGEELPTTRAIIHISKTGIHIVPTKPKGW